MKIYVTTCDKYMHLLKGFALQFNKYWSDTQSVIVLGFTPPDFELPSNFTFHSMEPKETRPWTDNLKIFFSSIEDDKFIWLMDDYWLTQKVDLSLIEEMKNLLDEGAVKSDLSNNTNYFAHGARGKYVVANRQAHYRTSTQPAIWDREWLISILKPGLDPWGFELQGPSLELNNGDIIGTTGQLVEFANVYFKGAPDSYMIAKLSDVDKKGLIEINAFDQFVGCVIL